MHDLKISIMTLTDGLEIAIAPQADESNKLFFELLSCFGDLENGTLKVKAEQTATKELKQKIAEYTKANSASAAILNKLNNRISKIPENQFFLVLNEFPTDTVLKHRLEAYLALLNKLGKEQITKEEFESEIKPTEDLFGELMENYNIHQPRNDRRTIIGNARKDDRRCRFCGNSLESGATFSRTAHAIPEALGNKNIILADECDECNDFFGKNIEPNLIEYLDIYRTFLGVKGKNGTPTINYKNGKILHKDGMAIVIADKINGTPEQGLTVTLRSSKKFTPIKLYKTLCKITLSTIDEQELNWLGTTIRWLRYGEAPSQEVPKVAINIVHSGFQIQPTITNYVRKSNDTSIPHLVSEFRIGSLVYVYTVPYSEKDDIDFSKQSDFDSYWKRFKHYNQVPGWIFQSFEGASEVTVNETIRMINAEKP